MKGMVFTEFLEMVEETWSADMVDEIIESSDLASGGVYTTLGTYDYMEMVQLVSHLARETGAAVPTLLHDFGVHLFSRFASGYPHFFGKADDAFGFLQNVEDYIHVEVRKLYPSAELPTFEYDISGPDTLVMTYRSRRPFGDLAEGLIKGCIAHFQEEVAVSREDLEGGSETCVRFTLRRSSDG